MIDRPRPAALIAVLVSALAIGACAQVVAKPRLRTALQHAGLSDRNAECMAGRMVDRLTIAQLRKLEELRPAQGKARGLATLSQFVERVRRVGDAEVIGVTASSAALCVTGLARVDAGTVLS